MNAPKYLFFQALVVKLPTFLEDVLKKMYVEYTKCSKMMNFKTRDNIILMRNSLMELFKINPSVTYVTVRLFQRKAISNIYTQSLLFKNVLVDIKQTHLVFIILS